MGNVFIEIVIKAFEDNCESALVGEVNPAVKKNLKMENVLIKILITLVNVNYCSFHVASAYEKS